MFFYTVSSWLTNASHIGEVSSRTTMRRRSFLRAYSPSEKYGDVPRMCNSPSAILRPCFGRVQIAIHGRNSFGVHSKISFFKIFWRSLGYFMLLGLCNLWRVVEDLYGGALTHQRQKNGARPRVALHTGKGTSRKGCDEGQVSSGPPVPQISLCILFPVESKGEGFRGWLACIRLRNQGFFECS